MATMQFAMCDIVADFLLRYPKVNVVAHATDRNVDLVGEKRAGLPNLRLYDLRHSAATLLFASGAPTKVVSEVLGHASVNLTQNTYIHVIPGMHQQAVRDMGAMLKSAAR
jgi:integrase